MTKLDIIEKVKDRLRCTSKEATAYVETVLWHIKETVASGESVKLARFGVFDVRQKKERKGRNPATGEAMPIVARRILIFKPSVLLRTAVNSQKPAAVEVA